MEFTFSFIIPVFNRPQEVASLLQSIAALTGSVNHNVVIVEDGSVESCEDVCLRFRESVNIQYYFKQNTGPGDSRNYGMQVAQGNYFIILDSDCLLPPNYLEVVATALKNNFVHCYGGPDAAHARFSTIQKAINYSMTSLLTTGGIRGASANLDTFQPRSFNMGLSKEAFLKSGGFGNIHPGEDPDLTLRLWNLGYRTTLIKEAFVYHERRISWKLFYKQVHKFGMVRVILNKWHPKSGKFTYFFPSLFTLGLLLSLILVVLGYYALFLLYVFYFMVIVIDSSIKSNLKVGVYSILASFIQFTGYGVGFAISYYHIKLRHRKEEEVFPHLFFKNQ